MTAAAAVAIVLGLPGHAAAAGGGASCGGQTSAVFSPADASRFASLWKGRILDQAYMTKYASTGKVPDDVKAEGFHGASAADQTLLSTCLVTQMLQDVGADASTPQDRVETVASVRRLVFSPGAPDTGPTGARATDPLAATPLSESTAQQKDLEAARTATVPDLPQAALEGPAAAAVPDPASDTLPGTVDVAPLTAATKAPATTTDGTPLALSSALPDPGGLGRGTPATAPVDDALRTVTGVADKLKAAAGGLVDPDAPERLLRTLRNPVPLDVASSQSPTIQAPAVQLAARRQAAPNAAAPAATGPLPVDVPSGLDPLAGAQLPAGLPSLTYRLCSQTTTKQACSLTLPLAVPQVADVTGDGTLDIAAELLPTVDPASLLADPLTGGGIKIGLRFIVKRLPTSETTGKALKAHVFFVYELPEAKKRLALGYDGLFRGDTLSDQTDTTYGYQAGAAGDGVMDVDLTANHQSPGTVFDNTFGLTTIRPDGGDQDPTIASAALTPVPENYVFHVRREAGTRTTIESTLDRASHLSLIAISDVDSAQPVKRSSALVDLQDLPTNAKADLIEATADSGERTTTGTLTLSAPIKHAQLFAVQQPDRTTDKTYKGAFLDLADIPLTTSVVVGSNDGTVRTSLRASDRISSLELAGVDVRGGKTYKALTGKVTSLPKELDLGLTAGDRKVDGTYKTDTSVPAVDVGYYDEAKEKTLALGKLRSIPTQVGLRIDGNAQTVDLDPNGPLGTLELIATRNESGVLIPDGKPDHVTLVRDGRKLGASVLLHGLAGVHAAYGDKLSLRTQFTPGGQPLVGLYQDEKQVGGARISNLPSDSTVTVDPTGHTATWRAASVIKTLDAYYQTRDGDRVVGLQLEDLPKSIDVGWGYGGQTDVTYKADSRLTKLVVGLREKSADDTRVTATLKDLPTMAHVLADRDARRLLVDLDSRIGSVEAAFQRGGAPLGTAAGDHAILVTRGSALGFTGKLTGLRGVDATFGDHPRGTVRFEPGGQSLVLGADIDLKQLARVDVSNLPSQIDFDVDPAGRKVSYRNSAKVRQLTATYVAKGTGPTVSAQLDDVPAQATASYETGGHPQADFSSTSGLTRAQLLYAPDDVSGGLDTAKDKYLAVDAKGLPAKAHLDLDLANAHVDWLADTKITSVAFLTNGLASLLGKPVAASGEVTGVPAHFDADFGGGTYRFRGISGPVGNVDLAATNHGTVTRLKGPHVAAHFDEPAKNLDASLSLPRISLASYARTGGATTVSADVDLGATPLGVDGDAILSSGSRYSLQGAISNMPSSFTVNSADGRLTYTADKSLGVTAAVRAGRTAALNGLKLPGYYDQGVAVVDGGCGSGCTGLAGTINITGLPKSVTVDPAKRSFAMKGSNLGKLVGVVDLDDVVSTPIKATAVLSGIPKALDVTVGPISFTSPKTGPDKVDVGYDASASAGRLEVQAEALGAKGYALVDKLPKTFSVKGTFGMPTDVQVDATGGIDVLKLIVNDVPVGGRTASGSAQLTDVPATMHLTADGFGKGGGLKVPKVTYTGAASTLDGTVFTDASIAKKVAGASLDLSDFSFGLADLGKSFTAQLNANDSVSLASAPRTRSIALGTSIKVGRVVKDISFDKRKAGGGITITGHAGIDGIDIGDAVIGVTDLASLKVTPGEIPIAFGVEGDYGRFGLSTSKLTIDPDVDLKIQIRVPLSRDPDPIKFVLDKPLTSTTFHVGDAKKRFIGSVTVKAGPFSCTAKLSGVPGPIAKYANGFETAGATGRQVVTVNPGGLVPDYLLNAATAFKLSPFPDMRDTDVDVGC